MEIIERLVAVEMTQKAMYDDLKEIKSAVVGNGQPGLRLRVDRLEQREVRREWTVRTLGAILFGWITKQVLG